MNHILTPVDETAWEQLLLTLEKQFGKKPDLQAIIFLIGHRELGQLKDKFSKEQKEELMHVGVCTLLEKAGLYTFIARDADGWPHWEIVRGMPKLNGEEQENLLKHQILAYFKNL
jgi:hypothetical protein